MDDSITRPELNKILAKALSLDTVEKMGIYHGLVELIKSAEDPRQAASIILSEIDILFQIKARTAHEKVESKIEGDATGRISPMFRRVGG